MAVSEPYDILKHYQGQLLQITQRNRSVLLRRIVIKHNFNLAKLDDIKSGVSDRAIIKAFKRGKSYTILLDSIQDNSDADSARSKLKTLARNLRQIEEETGQQTEYIGFPFLEGRLNPDFYVRGPIVLFPISIEHKRASRGGGWAIRPIGEPILNGALIAALRKKGGYIPPADYEDTFEQISDQISSYTIKSFLEEIISWINEIVPVQGGISRKPFQDLTGSMIQTRNDRLHVSDHRIIGSFPQADNEIYQDYDKLLKSDLSNMGIVGQMLGVEEDTENTSDDEPLNMDSIPDMELNTALDSDSSQDEVILEARRSEMIVVRGPPGTGKSQVIVNLVADALMLDQKVLVVCQKRAALEVVKQRLGRINLDRYAVFLNKELDDRGKMYRQIHANITEHPEPFAYNEQAVMDISRKIDQLTTNLGRFGAALAGKHFGGVTIQRLYTHADPKYRPVLDMTGAGFDCQWPDLEEYLQNIQHLVKPFQILDNRHPWYQRKSFADIDMTEGRIRGHLDRLISLYPSCIITDSIKSQRNLVSNFDTYLNKPGFLKMTRKRMKKKIHQALDVKVTDDYVRRNLERVKTGVKFWDTFQDILYLFGDKGRNDLATSTSLESRLRYLRDTLDFDMFREFDMITDTCDKSVLRILEQAKERLAGDIDWTDSIRQEIYHHWISEIEKVEPILKGDPVSRYERARDDLARLIKQKQQAVIKTIQRRVEGAIQPRDMYGPNRTVDQRKWRDFTGELQKKRKIKPVRKLFEEYSEQMLQVAPCWLTSPEVVSRVFPLKRGLFDLVIVDEASQLATERAIPFLYRARRAVVAGDEKQLPPFDLFQVVEDDIDDDIVTHHIPDEKSLLETARTKHRTINLVWHYRSEHQDLINFSNHAFYSGLLNAAPGMEGDPKKPPITHVRCNGMWDNRSNHVEAVRVVDVMKDIWSHSGRHSVGVITFNDKQKDLIENTIDKRLETDFEFAHMYHTAQSRSLDDAPFVKNIENVQGDERDVIIFSIGYARNAEGKMLNLFGTLSRKGGENRLNVAVTRSRKRMIVISSVDSSDIRPTSRNAGPRMLGQFLRYAEAVSGGDHDAKSTVLDDIGSHMIRAPDDTTGDERFDSEFEYMVHKRLTDLGYRVDTQVGFSGYRIDLAVLDPRDPHRYLLGIECDGATFHSAKSVRERDVMRQQFLEAKGWRIERIWSRNWWRNPDHEINRIKSRIDKLISAGT